MKLKDAVEKVLREARRPLCVEEITQRVIRKGLWETKGRTPAATVGAKLYMSVKNGERCFVQVAPGTFALFGDKKSTAKVVAGVEDSGYVYILTNPCFRKDWVKIGKTARPVDTRSKELDNTAIPLPFEVYAVLKTCHMTKVEKLIHGLIEEFNPALRIRRNREFFNIQPAKALGLLRKAADILDESENIATGESLLSEFAKIKRTPKCPETAGKRRMENKSRLVVGNKESWKGKTQLAKLIARRGGNEGAFGGILHFFSRKRPCVKSSKWREALEQVGLKFDANDYVIDWSIARNPL